MCYLTTHSTHFIYGYMTSDTRHIGYSFRLAARVLLYASSHRQDNTYHGFVTPVVEHWLEREITQWVHLMKDRSDDPSHHERTLLPRSYISLPICMEVAQITHWVIVQYTLNPHWMKCDRETSYCKTMKITKKACVKAWFGRSRGYNSYHIVVLPVAEHNPMHYLVKL